MNEPATAVAEPEIDSSETSFVDSFQAFMSGETPKAEPEPTPEPDPAPEPEPEPKVKPKTVDDIPDAKLSDEPDLKLPIDEDFDAPESEDDPDNPFDKSTPQHNRFREMRKEAAALKGDLETERQTRTQLETRVKEIEASANRAQELEKKVSEYEAKMAVLNLQESEAYKESIEKPLVSILKRSDAIADRYGIDPNELADAIEISDEKQRRAKFKELTSGLDVDPDDHVEIRTLAREIQPLKDRKSELLSNAEKALAELESEKTQAQEEQLLQAVEERKKTVDKVAKHVAGKIPFLKTMEGLDFDKMVDGLKEADFDSLDAPNKAYSQIAAQAFPAMVRQYVALTRQVEELSDELSSFKKQAPRMTANAGASAPEDDDDGLVTRFQKTFGG